VSLLLAAILTSRRLVRSQAIGKIGLLARERFHRLKTQPRRCRSHVAARSRLSRSKLTQISRNACHSAKSTGNFYRQIFFAAAEMPFLPCFIEFRDHLAIFQAIASC
jgi:hypothetical protein